MRRWKDKWEAQTKADIQVGRAFGAPWMHVDGTHTKGPCAGISVPWEPARTHSSGLCASLLHVTCWTGYWNKIQTHKRFKRSLFIRINLLILGGNPLYQATKRQQLNGIKRWKMRWKAKSLIYFWLGYVVFLFLKWYWYVLLDFRGESLLLLRCARICFPPDLQSKTQLFRHNSSSSHNSSMIFWHHCHRDCMQMCRLSFLLHIHVFADIAAQLEIWTSCFSIWIP